MEKPVSGNATMDGNLPISRMLTVSTSHVTQDTFEAMSLDGIRNEIMLPIYGKTTPDNGASFGLFVYLEVGLIKWDRIPKDLVPVLKLCLKSNCDVLCLDSDGMELEELPTYEWED